MLQASSDKNGKNVNIIVDDIYSRDPRVNTKYPAVMGADEKEKLSAYLASNKELYRQERKYGLINHAIVLKEVTVHDVRMPKLKHSSNLNGPGNANLVITSEELEKRGSLDLIHTIEKFVVSRIDPQAMTFILDGIRVHKDVISSLPIAMVASVEYLK